MCLLNRKGQSTLASRYEVICNCSLDNGPFHGTDLAGMYGTGGGENLSQAEVSSSPQSLGQSEAGSLEAGLNSAAEHVADAEDASGATADNDVETAEARDDGSTTYTSHASEPPRAAEGRLICREMVRFPHNVTSSQGHCTHASFPAFLVIFALQLLHICIANGTYCNSANVCPAQEV